MRGEMAHREAQQCSGSAERALSTSHLHLGARPMRRSHSRGRPNAAAADAAAVAPAAAAAIAAAAAARANRHCVAGGCCSASLPHALRCPHQTPCSANSSSTPHTSHPSHATTTASKHNGHTAQAGSAPAAAVPRHALGMHNRETRGPSQKMAPEGPRAKGAGRSTAHSRAAAVRTRWPPAAAQGESWISRTRRQRPVTHSASRVPQQRTRTDSSQKQSARRQRSTHDSGHQTTSAARDRRPHLLLLCCCCTS